MNIHSIIVIISGSIAFILNLCLIPIIILLSSPQIGKYKYLLLIYTIEAALFSLNQVIVDPTFHLFSKGYIMYSTTNYLPRRVGIYLLVSFASGVAQNIVIICLSFVYRYGCLCNQQVLQWFEFGWRLSVTALITFLGIAIPTYGIITITPFAASEGELLTNIFFEETGVNLSEIAYFAGFVHYPIGGPNFILLTAMFYYTALVGILFCIGGFCFYRIFTVLRNAPKTANSIYHKRLIILLALQACFPLIFNGFPLVFVFSCAFFGVESDNLADYVGSVLTFAQICDPILVFSFISCYRDGVFRILRKINVKSRVKNFKNKNIIF